MYCCPICGEKDIIPHPSVGKDPKLPSGAKAYACGYSRGHGEDSACSGGKLVQVAAAMEATNTQASEKGCTCALSILLSCGCRCGAFQREKLAGRI